MDIRQHLDTYESEYYDLAFSVYKVDGEIELWIQVGGAQIKIPLNYIEEMADMFTAIQEYMEDLEDEG